MMDHSPKIPDLKRTSKMTWLAQTLTFNDRTRPGEEVLQVHLWILHPARWDKLRKTMARCEKSLDFLWVNTGFTLQFLCGQNVSGEIFETSSTIIIANDTFHICEPSNPPKKHPHENPK